MAIDVYLTLLVACMTLLVTIVLSFSGERGSLLVKFVLALILVGLLITMAVATHVYLNETPSTEPTVESTNPKKPVNQSTEPDNLDINNEDTIPSSTGISTEVLVPQETIPTETTESAPKDDGNSSNGQDIIEDDMVAPVQSAFQNWYEEHPSVEDMEMIVDHLIAYAAECDSIEYSHCEGVNEHSNSFYYAGDEGVRNYSTLESLCKAVEEGIRADQYYNHCTYYYITYEWKETQYAISVIMEYAPGILP